MSLMLFSDVVEPVTSLYSVLSMYSSRKHEYQVNTY